MGEVPVVHRPERHLRVDLENPVVLAPDRVSLENPGSERECLAAETDPGQSARQLQCVLEGCRHHHRLRRGHEDAVATRPQQLVCGSITLANAIWQQAEGNVHADCHRRGEFLHQSQQRM